jgi:endonuclease/exonuclease/phosphatase family metal-dependent hydrolase
MKPGGQQAGIIRVMSWNALAGGWPRRDALASVIRDSQPDIVGLQEIEPRTLEALADRMGMERLAGVSASGYGSPVGILSRWPVRPGPSHADAPLHNAVLEATVALPDAAPLRVFVAHLAAEYSAWRAGEDVRLRELRYILACMSHASHASQASQARAADDEPQLLMGDFNSLAPGERLCAARLLLRAAENDAARAQGVEMKGLPGVAKVVPPSLRPLGEALVALARWGPAATALDAAVGAYIPRAVVAATRAAGLADLAAAEQPDPRQRAMTCPSDEPAGRIDYIFASAALAKGLIACAALTGPVARAASDHRPVMATLALGRSLTP